jgi:BNR repeat-like domain
MKPFNIFITLLVLLVLLTVQVLPINAQEQTWQTPFEVSKPAIDPSNPKLASLYPSSWFPNITVAQDGSVHVIWNSGTPLSSKEDDSSDLLMYRVLRGGQWSQVNNIVVAGAGGYTVRNGIAYGRDGRLHVTLRTRTTIAYTSAYWQDAWLPQSWDALYPVSSQNTAYYNSLAVDSKGILHLVWSETILDDPNGITRSCANCANLFYRSSSDAGSTWSSPINLSNSLDGDNRPQIVIDTQDRIHVAWDQGRDWYAGAGLPKRGVYRRSDDNGKTWTKEYYFAPLQEAEAKITRDAESANPEAPQQITLAVLPNGNPAVVYRTVGGAIYFQVSTNGGETWGSARLIKSIQARDNQGDYLDKYSMAADASGNLHLLMVGYRSEDAQQTAIAPPELLYLKWNGRGWSVPETIQKNLLYPEYPTVIVWGNTLHVVWYSRNHGVQSSGEARRYRIWYTSRKIDGAPVVQLPLFTAIPVEQPTVAVEPTVAPLPTPLPTAVLTAPVLERPPAWEAEAIPLIIYAVLPVITLFGIIIGTHMLRNRRR